MSATMAWYGHRPEARDLRRAPTVRLEIRSSAIFTSTLPQHTGPLTLRNDEFAKALAKYGALANSSQTLELALAIDHVLSSGDIAKILAHLCRRSQARSLRPHVGECTTGHPAPVNVRKLLRT